MHGGTGSGKTHVAARIAEIAGLPLTEADQLTWEPGWVEVPLEEQRRRITTVCDGDGWVLDTAYGSWLDIPLDRAQLVVALDYPQWFSFQRLVRRSVARAWDKRSVCNGNTETWRAQLLSRDSILLWHARSYGRKRRRVAAGVADPDGPRVVRLTSQRDRRLAAGAAGPLNRATIVSGWEASGSSPTGRTPDRCRGRSTSAAPRTPR